MTAAEAWLILADRADASVTNDDEQLVVCQALHSVAEAIGQARWTAKLQATLAANDRIERATMERMRAQMEFRELLEPEAEA